jgi:hypothetical protein
MITIKKEDMSTTANEVTTVSMTAEELAQFEQFRAEQQQKEEVERTKREFAAYKEMVEEAIKLSVPELVALSELIAKTKAAVLNRFESAIAIKAQLFGVKSDQRSHTFSSADGQQRVMVGQYVTDGYADTVNEGIAIVKDVISGMAKDEDSRALVNAVLRLMSRDNAGNLKASRVLQLSKMAEDSGNARFIEGVKIIQDAYRPEISKRFVKVDQRKDDDKWEALPLGMTEA